MAANAERILSKRRARTALLLLLLFGAAWLPRTLALDEFVTIDERKWLARSANFYQAITHGDLANTFQREHPGVTVMLAGLLGLLQEFPDYAERSPGQFTWERENFEAWLETNTDLNPLQLLAAGRWWIALGSALILTLSFFPLRRLFGAQIGALAVLFLAWNPFVLALSRQLHPDGFVAGLTYLALACFLTWLYAGRHRRYLIVSGMVMGLAWLTKTPAIFLVPTSAILIGVEWWRKWHYGTEDGHQQTPSFLIGGFVVWGLSSVVMFVLLWPAMWLDPLGTLLRMAAEMGAYVERHTSVNYFMGAPTADPGAIFYPIAYLFRATPATLFGLAAAAFYGWRRAVPFDRPAARRSAVALVIFAVVFTIGMTAGAKKFDRYILPVFLALDTVAVLGWVAVAQGVVRWWDGRHSMQHRLSVATRAAGLLLGVTLFLHAMLGFVHYPYYLTYYNPLLGGSLTAPHTLFVGWGEGLEDAAAWLNERQDAEKLRVVAWYADGPFSYFFDGQEVSAGSGSPLFWLDVDYVVTYVNQWQRQLPSPEAIDFFDSRTPVHTVRSGGLDLAHVYDMRAVVLPDFVEIGKESAADFGGQIRLAAYEIERMQVEPGDEILATLYLQSLAPMDVNYNVLVQLENATGDEIWRADRWPWGAATRDWPVRDIRPDGHEIAIPPDAAPGLYRLSVGFYDPETLEPLPISEMNSDQLIDGDARPLALIQVGDPAPLSAQADAGWQFGDHIELVSADLPGTMAGDTELPLVLTWRALATIPTDYTVFVHVVDKNGEQVAQRDQPPQGGFAATRLWNPGLLVEDKVHVPLPRDLIEGRYEVRVGLYTLDDGRLPVSQDGAVIGDFAAVGEFLVP